MQSQITALPDQLRLDMDRIRSGVDAYVNRGHTRNAAQAPSLMAWADQMLQYLHEWLLDEEQKELLQLNPWDLFILHASACLCHIHLARPNSTVGSSEASRNTIALASKEPGDSDAGCIIKMHWEALGIRHAPLAAAIADVCTAADHGSVPRDMRVDGSSINAPLISAAIGMAKALSLKSPDTTKQVCAYLPAAGLSAVGHYNEAISITGVGGHPYLANTIQMKLECRDPELHRALKHHERSVQRQLDHYNRVASPRFLYSDVLYEIQPVGYAPMDLKFSVDTSAALHLLTGNRLYSDNRVFLRELIQNAVDACNLRKRLEPSHEPAISVHFNEDISIVTVRDNGIGMDRQWIEKYFLTIGISLYQSSEVRSDTRRSRIDFNFISQFGIGFLSSFLVADKIIIKTRKAGRSGLVISIANLRDYFDVRPLEDEFEPGTEVSLHLKASKINYCRSLEYTGYLKTNIRFLDIPVTLRSNDGQTFAIGCEQLSYENRQTADVDFIAPLNFKHSEGFVLLRAKKNVDHIIALDTAKGGVSIFQDGIFITQIDTLLPEGARQSAVGRINLKGQDKCTLSMDRNRIFWSDAQLLNIKKTIRLGLAQAANLLVETIDSQGVSDQVRTSIINNLSIFFDFNEVDDAVHQLLCEPIRQVVDKRFRNFVRIHFAHTNRAEGIPEADGYSQQWQQQIVASFRKN